MLGWLSMPHCCYYQKAQCGSTLLHDILYTTGGTQWNNNQWGKAVGLGENMISCPQETMQYSINIQAAVFPNTGISSKFSRASECLFFGKLLLCQVFGGLIDCTLPLVLMSNPIHKKEHAYVLFGTLAVWVHHITHSVFDVGPNSIQVLSHTICNKPSIPLKSASSTTNCCLLDSDMELENFQISMNQKTNLLSCEIIPCMSWLMWMWLRSCSVIQMSKWVTKVLKQEIVNSTGTY